MCGPSGGGNTTTTQKFEPPEYTQEGWKDYIGAAQDVTSRPFQNYNMPRVAPVNSNQLAGLNMAASRGLEGDPYGNSARGLGLQTMQGDFLHSNPYLDQQIDDTSHNMSDAFASGTAAQNDAMFNRAGAFGGGSWENKQRQDALGMTRAVGQMGTQARSQNYDFERGQQANAMGMAPAFAAGDWQDIKGLTGAGDAENAHLQSLLDSGYQQMQDQINYPQQQLDAYGTALARASGTYGGTTSSSSGGGMSPLAGLLGLGAGAYGLKAGGFF